MNVSDTEWERINQEAAKWRARLHGDDSPATRAAFEAWLAEHPAHGQANAAFEAVEAKTRLTTLPIPPLHPAQPMWRPSRPAAWMAIAASLLLVCALVLQMRERTIHRSTGQDYASDTVIRAFPLEGGADVIVDAHSLVRTDDPNSHGGFVLVGGRARFSTPSSIPESFSVSLEPLRVKGRGATFDVRRSGDGVRIVDVAGRVDIEHQGQATASETVVHLSPGDAFVRDAQGERIVTATRDEMRWTTAMLPLDGLTLGEVIAIGNRSSGKPISLGDPSMAGMQLQGQLAAVDTAALARQLAAAFDLDLVSDAKQLVLTRKK